MNDIEKLIAATRTEHDGTKPAARFFVRTAIFLNVVVPILLVVGIVLAFCLLK
ncbi:MAG: hypothetical protein WCA19_17730 [Candidatus Acidiferrales bacterium]